MSPEHFKGLSNLEEFSLDGTQVTELGLLIFGRRSRKWTLKDD